MIAKWFCIVALLLSVVTSSCRASDGPEPDKSEIDEVRDRSDETSILAAIAKGDLDELKRLETAFDPARISNLASYVWRSPNVDLIVYLREQKKVVASDLQIAAVRGDVKEVVALLKRANDEEYPPGSEEGRMNATDFGYWELGSDTALRLAIRRGNTEVVRTLVAGWVNVNERLIDARRQRQPNEYPLSEAVQLGNSEIVQILVDGKAVIEDPPTRYSQKDQRINLSEFYQVHKQSPKDVIEQKLKQMLDEGLIIRERDPEANVVCPLILAIRNGRAKNVAILLKAGANPNVLIGDEGRPLHAAILKGDPAIVQLLVEHGADVNAPYSKGGSPLLYATHYKQGDIADILRAAGAKE